MGEDREREGGREGGREGKVPHISQEILPEADTDEPLAGFI